MNIKFEDAKNIIDQVRNVIFAKPEQRMQGPWIETILREGFARPEQPTGFSCGARDNKEPVVHATIMDKDKTQPICRWKQ